ncbi:YrhK family protein [Celerinatantimonas sp. MCCC 1A17872]|uniref:YrhK family protein n=1 Tax=Celerinatantimonas sp. MCCC 1A17872 TaxID=3177514 RepID=UPI0038C7C5E5
MQPNESSNDLIVKFGHDELIIHRRYEVLSIVNDLLLALWFIIGSICFFYSGTIQDIGTWLFLIGSCQLLIRPVIRLARSIHLQHLPDSSQNY